MTKITWTKDDFIIEENEVEGFSIDGEKKLIHTQTLVIPDGVKSIKRNAFSQKDIKKLVLPASLVSIYEAAFLNCKIIEVEGGENVEVLEKNAFSYNIISDVSNFKNIRCIKRAAFCGNKITNFKAPKTLKFIDGNAFCDNGILICDLRDTENLKISQHAFERNGMEELYLGKNADIEEYAFFFNDIQTIIGIESAEIKQDAFKEGIRKSYKKNFEILPDNLWTKEDFRIERNELSGLSQSGKMKLGDSNSITIPHIEGVDTIGGYLLYNLDKIKFVYISDGYTTIGQSAFCDAKVEYIRLPQDLKRIEGNAFKFSKLKCVKIPKTVTTIGEEAFRDSSLIKADLSECKIKVLRERMFNACTDLREVILPKTLTKINNSSFDSTRRLKNIEIPEKVEEIQSFAFSESGVRNIHFKNNLTSMTIYDRAFINSKLTKIVGDDLMFNFIGQAAFEDTFLEEFKAKYVGKFLYVAFKFSPLSLVEVKDVRVVDSKAFWNNGIKKVKLGGTIKIQKEAFSLNLIEDLEFFDEFLVENIYNGAFLKNNLKKIHLGEHVERIGQYAFFGNPIEEFEISEETEIQMLEF